MTTTSPARPAVERPLWMWVRFAGLAVSVPGVWALGRFDVLPHIPLCAFQWLWHKPCPGCGMTRSILRLSQGDLAGSLRMHPLGVVLAAMLLAALAGTGVGLVRGGDPVERFLERRGYALVIALIVGFVVTWVIRAFLVPEWAPPPVQ